MAFSFKRQDDTVEDGLRRIADDQIGKAIAETGLKDRQEAIHQVRKRCKKLRGLIRLVRLAFDDYADENVAFRDAARSLSGLRDGDVLVESHDALMSVCGQERRAEFAQVRRRLTVDARGQREILDLDERLSRVRQSMEAARERASGWTLDGDGFDAIGPGLKKTLKRARKTMAAAHEDGTDEAMHDWRKRVKYHWYHARLLSRIAPAMMGAHVDASKRLSDLLGDQHDLAVLDKKIVGWGEDALGPATDLSAYRTLLGERKSALSSEAFDLGRLLLAEHHKALVKRWSSYWDLWRKGAMSRDRIVIDA